jgi:glucose-1-phosphate cytidylyltransferase
MKTVILCGGRGTRLGERGKMIPKGLIKIGDEPILTHLMRCYAAFELKEFILCLGFRGAAIRNHFVHHRIEACTTHFVDTGLKTSTGGRLKQIRALIADDEDFCMTYGDGLSDVNLKALIEFHQHHGKIATLTAVHPFSAFGLLTLNDDNRVSEFREKPRLTEWVNGGFFVFNRKVFDYLSDDCVLEREPFERLAAEHQLMAFTHEGFWKCLDTFKDHLELNQLWDEGHAAWRV